MDAVVVERDVFCDGVAGIRRDAIDIDDDALAPLLDLDMFRLTGCLHRDCGGRFGFSDRLGVAIGLDSETVLGAQPEADLDDVLRHGRSPSM